MKFHPNFCLQKRDSREKVCLDSKRIRYLCHSYQNGAKHSYCFQVCVILELWIRRLKNQRLSWTIIWQRVAWTRVTRCVLCILSRVSQGDALLVCFISLWTLQASILWWYTTSDEPQRRILFLKNLSLSLMKEHLVSRSQIPSLPRDVPAFLEKYHPLPVEDDGDGVAGRPPKKRGNCFMCGRQKKFASIHEMRSVQPIHL